MLLRDKLEEAHDLIEFGNSEEAAKGYGIIETIANIQQDSVTKLKILRTSDRLGSFERDLLEEIINELKI